MMITNRNVEGDQLGEERRRTLFITLVKTPIRPRSTTVRLLLTGRDRNFLR